MLAVDKRIIEFIQEHHVLTIATSIYDQPYCANCFYVYLKEENLFVFTSDQDTRHGREFLENKNVAGSVVLETSVVGRIQGVQFTGEVFVLKDNLLSQAKKRYLKKFPVAVLMKTNLWAVRPDYLKMTHNKLGFGKKLIWKKGSGVNLEGKDD